MKTRKRTFIKTFFLSLVRYEKWKMDPRNVEIVARMEMYTPKIAGL